MRMAMSPTNQLRLQRGDLLAVGVVLGFVLGVFGIAEDAQQKFLTLQVETRIRLDLI